MGNKIVYKGYNVGETTQVSIMPTATADNSGAIVQYVGATNANYTNGYFYKCVSDGGVTPAYSWEKMQVSDGGDTIQVETLPTAGTSEVGNIYQYIGATTTTLTNGYFYECVEDSGSYSWVEKEVQKNEDVPHWSGTRAEYEAQKDNIEDGTYVSILDDIDTHELVDVVEEDNMNPVTSNAVANADEELYTKVVNNLKPTAPSAQVVLKNEAGDLTTAKSYTATHTGLLRVHFLKRYSGNTITLVVNGRAVDSVPNYTGPASDVENPITTGVLIAFVRAGDSITINSDGNGENWYVQNVTIQPISWFVS